MRRFIGTAVQSINLRVPAAINKRTDSLPTHLTARCALEILQDRSPFKTDTNPRNDPLLLLHVRENGPGLGVGFCWYSCGESGLHCNLTLPYDSSVRLRSVTDSAVGPAFVVELAPAVRPLFARLRFDRTRSRKSRRGSAAVERATAKDRVAPPLKSLHETNPAQSDFFRQYKNRELLAPSASDYPWARSAAKDQLR